ITPVSYCVSYLSLLPRPTTTLFPYTTLFRSDPISHPLTLHGQLGPQILIAQRARDRVGIEQVPLPAEGSDALEDRDHDAGVIRRSEEHTSELQSRENLVCRLLLEKKK